MRFSEYKNKKVLIVGLGISGGGVGAAQFLAKQGADITVADIKTKKALAESIKKLKKYKNIHFFLGVKNIEHRMLNTFDAAVVNPAVDVRSPIVKKIQKLKIPIASELEIFLKHCKGKVIAITGTKGKGTVATFVYQILRKAKKDAMLGGNIGVSLLDKLSKIKKSTYIVLEISSFQLDLLRRSQGESRLKRDRKPNFHTAALINIYPDHLDRYNSFSDYKKSKLSIFKYQARYNIDGRKIKTTLPDWVDVKRIKLIGEHNKKNINIAIEIATRLGISKVNIEKAMYRFRGLPHRLEYMGVKKGIAFYNDSYSTTPDSTIMALRSFSKPVILIMGGIHKELSFKKLAYEAKKHVKIGILFGKSAREIKRAFKNVKSSTLDIMVVKTLPEAIREAKKIAHSGDIILFSPACASFDQFRNAKERGETFKKLIQNF